MFIHKTYDSGLKYVRNSCWAAYGIGGLPKRGKPLVGSSRMVVLDCPIHQTQRQLSRKVVRFAFALGVEHLDVKLVQQGQ